MQRTLFNHEVGELFAELVALIADFNAWWPGHLRGGQLWPLPIHKRGEPFVPGGEVDQLSLRGAALIGPAQAAIAQLHLCGPQQDPTTTLRAPGWIALDAPAADRVQAINRARQAIADRVDAEIATMNLAATTAGNMRGKLLRGVLPGISPRHLLRKLQVFDSAPRSIQFHWANAGASYTRVKAKAERERLLTQVSTEATARRIAADDTGHQRSLDRLTNLADETPLLVARPLTPHPRVMLFFESRSRYDAMPHANLPIFVHCPADTSLPHVRPLPDLQAREDRRGQRGRTRLTLLCDYNPNRRIYLDEPERKERRHSRLAATIASTYGSE